MKPELISVLIMDLLCGRKCDAAETMERIISGSKGYDVSYDAYGIPFFRGRKAIMLCTVDRADAVGGIFVKGGRMPKEGCPTFVYLCDADGEVYGRGVLRNVVMKTKGDKYSIYNWDHEKKEGEEVESSAWFVEDVSSIGMGVSEFGVKRRIPANTWRYVEEPRIIRAPADN